MSNPRLRIEGVAKSFGATQALKNVSLCVAPGESHAMIGENGAGKSTLMKILSGAHRPDRGRIELDGEPFNPRDPLHARRSGIAMIYQELNLAPHLSVEENIMLGDEPSAFGFVRKSERRRRAREALAELGHDSIDLDAPVYTRTIAEQQIVEIARALLGRPKVLIMDEPTSSLPQFDTDNLFAAIDRLRARNVSIIYISHFLEECQQVCERFTVLRDGEAVQSGAMDGADLNDIIRHMVGRDMKDIYPAREAEFGEPALELRQVAGRVKPRQVSLTLRRGEVFGLAGLIGAGRTETARVCFGLDQLKAGRVLVMGNASAAASPSARLRQGVGFLSENRKEEGLMLNRSIADNLTMTKLKPVTSLGFVRNRRQNAVAHQWIQKLNVRTQGPSQHVGYLSGGNQQKIALGRLLHHDADILLLDEPTRGIDVGSKSQIYRLINELAGAGKAILFISSYLPELLGVCDTIGVMCRGTLVESKPAREWTEHSIIAAAIGQSSKAQRASGQGGGGAEMSGCGASVPASRRGVREQHPGGASVPASPLPRSHESKEES